MKSGIIVVTIVILFLIHASTSGGLSSFMSIVTGSGSNMPSVAGVQPLTPVTLKTGTLPALPGI